jgi:hypothetical protein
MRPAPVPPGPISIPPADESPAAGQPGAQSLPATGLPAIPAGSAARRLALDAAALAAVADTLGVALAEAPFRAGDQPVYRLAVPVTGEAVGRGASDHALPCPGPATASPGLPVTTLTVWPALARVDVANPMASVTATGLVAVDLIPGVEAIFRHPGGSVTVARNGRVMVRQAGAPPAAGTARDDAGATDR